MRAINVSAGGSQEGEPRDFISPMTHQQHAKAQILEQIKAYTNSGRHQEAMGLYQRYFCTRATTAETGHRR